MNMNCSAEEHSECSAHSNHKMAAVYLICPASGLATVTEVLQERWIQNDSHDICEPAYSYY